MSNPLRWIRVVAIASIHWLLPTAAEASAQVYVPLPPCRAVDTRTSQGGTGALAAGELRAFQISGTSGFEGPNAGGCGIPEGTPALASAVMMNIVAAAPTGPGNLRAWPLGDVEPLASVVNFSAAAGTNLANGVIVPVYGATASSDINVRASFSSVDVIIDVLGYFTDLTTLDGPGSTLDADTLDGIDGSAFGRLTAGNTWSGTNSFTGGVNLGNSPVDPISVAGTIQGGMPLTFEGSAVDSNEMQFALVGPTADRTITFPDASGEVSLLGQTVSGTEISDVTRSVNLPISGFRDCFGGVLDGMSGADDDADFGLYLSSVLAVIWDADAGSEDDGSPICASVFVPDDYKSGGAVVVRAVKSGHSGNTETLFAGVGNESGFIDIDGISMPSASPLTYTYDVSPLVAPDRALTVWVSAEVISSPVMDDHVAVLGVKLNYVAEQ